MLILAIHIDDCVFSQLDMQYMRPRISAKSPVVPRYLNEELSILHTTVLWLWSWVHLEVRCQEYITVLASMRIYRSARSMRSRISSAVRVVWNYGCPTVSPA